jgi:F0F1-type ATP synthase assembly protein I
MSAPKKPNPYLKYTALGSEMIGAVVLGAWAGHSLDTYLEFKFPIFTILLIFAGLTSFFIRLIRALKQDE